MRKGFTNLCRGETMLEREFPKTDRRAASCGLAVAAAPRVLAAPRTSVEDERCACGAPLGDTERPTALTKTAP